MIVISHNNDILTEPRMYIRGFFRLLEFDQSLAIIPQRCGDHLG
jgi:hypothetical protein